jgi:hypothetical protein
MPKHREVNGSGQFDLMKTHFHLISLLSRVNFRPKIFPPDMSESNPKTFFPEELGATTRLSRARLSISTNTMKT